MAYTAIRELGQGTFGIVELVADENGDEWARKSYKDPKLPGIDSDQIRRRFDREVRYQSLVQHPNVVEIIDHDLSEDPPFFIMEVAEITLRDELAADRTLGGAPSKALFDILAGLEAIHASGIIHRDLKPANVLKFSDSTQEPFYAISDFGLMTAAESDSSSLTASGIGGGTPYYAAPECASNFKRATTKSDIYSFGAILHDIFAGGAARIPYTELSDPGPVGPIIARCTKKLPQRRYKSVNELRSALYDALNTHVIQFASIEEEAVVELLRNSSELNDDEWDRVFILIDETEEKNESNENIFGAITHDHLSQLNVDAPDLFAHLGRSFCNYVRDGVFAFDYCDVLAGKVQVFYDLGELDLKALAAVALLVMGTGHNRWSVEHRFVEMAGAEIPEKLAERIRIEFEVQQINLVNLIVRLEGSIDVSRSRFHPIFQEMLQG